MTLRLSSVIAGASWQGSSEDDLLLEFPNGEELIVPRLNTAACQQILAQDRYLLRDVPLYEIVAFLNLVGRSWKSPEYSRRRLYVRYLQKYLGYSREAADLEANWITLLLCSHYRLFDTIGAELGNRNILDRWVPVEEAEVRAFPRGRSLHVVAGNVPLSGVASVLRALVTKNVCVVKPSSEDPITPAMLALSFLDANPRHPVAKAMSVAFWDSKRPPAAVMDLLSGTDVACVWGGAGAIDWAVRSLPAEAEVIKFGPRRSLAVVAAAADVGAAARNLAHNICMYDQRACFSVRQVFVQMPVERFVPAVREAFELYGRILPKGFQSTDDRARWALAQLDARYQDELVDCGPGQDWSIVSCRPNEVDHHPLGRTLYIHPIRELSEIVEHVTPEVQTIAITPYSQVFELRDAVARAGACRIVDLGLANVFRLGGTHDGMYPSQRLVRLVSTESAAQEHPKGITLPIDQTTFLEENRFVEFIP